MNNSRSMSGNPMGDISRFCLFAVALALLDGAPLTASFTAHHNNPALLRLLVAGSPVTHCQRRMPLVLHATDNPTYDPEEEVKRRLVRAKEVLAISKAKLESKKDNDAKSKATESATEESAGTEANAEPVPFFAAKGAAVNPKRRQQVIKATNEKTGLVTADGEKMAAMSEKEEWEFRSLLEVFEMEVGEGGDIKNPAPKTLADRDVAASIWNLRRLMKTEDYLKIFDKKNFFIGEDN